MPLLEPVDPAAFVEQLRSLRQIRQFTDEPIDDSLVEDLLQVARWTGSAKNTQPWHFVVLTDPEVIRKVADAGATSGFLTGAPLVIVIVMSGKNQRTEPYDEGRVSERIMLAADAHGLGSGTGWFGDGESVVKELLGIPEGMAVKSAVGVGHPVEMEKRRSVVEGGRTPLSEIVSRESYGS